MGRDREAQSLPSASCACASPCARTYSCPCSACRVTFGDVGALRPGGNRGERRLQQHRCRAHGLNGLDAWRRRGRTARGAALAASERGHRDTNVRRSPVTSDTTTSGMPAAGGSGAVTACVRRGALRHDTRRAGLGRDGIRYRDRRGGIRRHLRHHRGRPRRGARRGLRLHIERSEGVIGALASSREQSHTSSVTPARRRRLSYSLAIGAILMSSSSGPPCRSARARCAWPPRRSPDRHGLRRSRRGGCGRPARAQGFPCCRGPRSTRGSRTS